MAIEKNVVEYRPVAPMGQFAEMSAYEPAADMERIAGVVRRQYRFALIGAAIGGLIAILALLFIQPSYQANVRILVDQDRTRLLTQISGEQAPASTDDYIATQIAIINSDIVARRVVHGLKLQYDPDARRLRLPPAASSDETQPRLSRITSEALVSSQADQALIGAVRRSMSVSQVDKSFVIEINAKDPDPEVARRLAAAYGEAYLTDQLSARFEATKSAGSWLEDRINTLRDQSLQANADVEKFRSENNLVATDGRLLSDQQLGSLNEQFVAAQLAVTRATAKVNVFKAAVDRNDVVNIIGIVGSSTEIPETALVRTIRSDYLEASSRAAEIAARWGEDNDQVRALRAVIARQSGLLLDEARRLLEGYQSELRTLQSQADATAASVEAATSHSQADNSTLVALRSIEQRSASYNALYQDYLARYQEAVQQQTLSLTTGRVISTAELPGSPVYPNKKIVLALLLILGAGVGGAIGVGRELFDQTFRSRRDVEREGVEFLGYVTAPGSDKWGLTIDARLAEGDATTYVVALAERIDRCEKTLDTVHRGIEICRRAPNKVVAIVSLEASLSRSALALGLAIREARQGRRILLVDGDRQGRVLSKALSPDGAQTSSDVIAGRAPFESVARSIGENIRFLPAEGVSWQGGSAGSFSAENLKSWAMAFDLVIVDLPPAGPISEARALGPALDGYICAVEWGRTARDSLTNILRSGSSFGSKLIGVAIANVDDARQPLYDREYIRAS